MNTSRDKINSSKVLSPGYRLRVDRLTAALCRVVRRLAAIMAEFDVHDFVIEGRNVQIRITRRKRKCRTKT